MFDLGQSASGPSHYLFDLQHEASWELYDTSWLNETPVDFSLKAYVCRQATDHQRDAARDATDVLEER